MNFPHWLTPLDFVDNFISVKIKTSVPVSLSSPFYNNLQIEEFNGQFQNCNMEKFRQLYVA